MYDMYPEAETWTSSLHQFNGGLGHGAYEGLFEEGPTASEVAREAEYQRELAQCEALGPVVAQHALAGADVRLEA